MPRCFFHIHDGQDLPDEKGVDLAGMAEVRAEAIRTAGSMLREHSGKLKGEEWRMEVVDHHSRVVLTLRFSMEETSLHS